jgi:hypothetical protein
VINTITNQVVDLNTNPGSQNAGNDPITLNGINPKAVAINTANNRLYVTSTDSTNGAGQVWVINTSTNAVLDQVAGGNPNNPDPITIANTPTAMAVKGSTIYVTHSNGTVSRINTTNNSVTTITVAPGISLAGVAIRPASGTITSDRLYVTGSDGKLYVIAIVPAI